MSGVCLTWVKISIQPGIAGENVSHILDIWTFACMSFVTLREAPMEYGIEKLMTPYDPAE